MKDDNGNELEPGQAFEFEGQIDSSVEPEMDKDSVLFEGEYMIYVPPGQKATVVYSVAVNDEEKSP